MGLQYTEVRVINGTDVLCNFCKFEKVSLTSSCYQEVGFIAAYLASMSMPSDF